VGSLAVCIAAAGLARRCVGSHAGVRMAKSLRRGSAGGIARGIEPSLAYVLPLVPDRHSPRGISSRRDVVPGIGPEAVQTVKFLGVCAPQCPGHHGQERCRAARSAGAPGLLGDGAAWRETTRGRLLAPFWQSHRSRRPGTSINWLSMRDGSGPITSNTNFSTTVCGRQPRYRAIALRCSICGGFGSLIRHSAC